MEEQIRLVGAHEVRELLGVSRQRVYQLAARADFPQPVATLAQGKVWLLGDIERWLDRRRLLAGRPQTTTFEQEVHDLGADFVGVA
jgi:prophage regulatory protein